MYVFTSLFQTIPSRRKHLKGAQIFLVLLAGAQVPDWLETTDDGVFQLVHFLFVLHRTNGEMDVLLAESFRYPPVDVAMCRCSVTVAALCRYIADVLIEALLEGSRTYACKDELIVDDDIVYTMLLQQLFVAFYDKA